jgi:hypothetical protein
MLGLLQLFLHLLHLLLHTSTSSVIQISRPFGDSMSLLKLL